MENTVDLEFRPYHGEGVHPNFQYEKKYQPIMDFFNKDAKKCIKQLISKAFIISVNDEIVGYIAISFKSIEKRNLKGNKQSGKFDRPALVIGQLIFDSRHQHKGYGSGTIKWVISLVRIVQQFLPLRLLFVDAIDEQAASFYKSRGFEPMQDDPDSLVLDLLPILEIVKNIEKNST